ncbi:MAG: hypothetical protein ACI9C3_002525, partial [Yoonia sp.]
SVLVLSLPVLRIVSVHLNRGIRAPLFSGCEA